MAAALEIAEPTSLSADDVHLVVKSISNQGLSPILPDSASLLFYLPSLTLSTGHFNLALIGHSHVAATNGKITVDYECGLC